HAYNGSKVELRRCLDGRMLDGGLRQLHYFRLNQHDPREGAAHEIIHVATAGIIQTLLAGYRRSLERVLANVDNSGHVGGKFLSRPPVWLLEELKLEVIIAKGTEMRTGKVEELMASGRSLARHKSHLVVTIEMVLVGAAFQRHPL